MDAGNRSVLAQPSIRIFSVLAYTRSIDSWRYFTYQWYLLRPQPVAFNVDISVPGIPNIHGRGSNTQTLRIKFSADRASLLQQKRRAEKYPEYNIEIPNRVLAIENVNSSAIKGVTITPAIEGEWHASENEVLFTPEKHWPANTRYSLAFEPSVFVDLVHLRDDSYSFITESLGVEVRNSSLHADPNSPTKQRYISMLEFSHPISRDSLEQKLDLKIQDSNLVNGYENLGFSVAVPHRC